MNYYSDVTTYRFYNKRHQLVQRASIVVICFTLFRNIRPCTILGYTLTNIPQKFNADKNNTEKNLHQVASCNRRRTLHYEWVQREIESLERAGVITKSMSKWASPIVIVPKKSAPGEPPKRRLCVDFRKVNKLQQEVITAGKTKGQISIHPLLKINEMYAKLKGAKVFSTIDLRSGYHHIALGKSSRAKTAFVTPFGKY